MANKRLSKEKQVFVLAALCEGTPINAVCRMFKVGKHAVLRLIAESGEALADYMDKNFRDLPCGRIEMDEQWQYVGKHGQRMVKKEEGRGDFWLWACIDADTKLVFSHRVGSRKKSVGNAFVQDVSKRVKGHVQIATDNHRSYSFAIREHFGYEGYSYGTETKVFGALNDSPANSAFGERKNGVPKIVTAERRAIINAPDLGSLTTCHIERAFLTVRQELTRFTRCTLAYSKDLEMHRLAVALNFGKGIGNQTPAQAAGIEEGRWSLEDVVELTAVYMRRKEDAKFEAAFTSIS